MIEFECPHCGNHFEVEDALAGRDGWCRVCKKMIIIPSPTARAWDDLSMEERFRRCHKLLQFAATKADKYKRLIVDFHDENEMLASRVRSLELGDQAGVAGADRAIGAMDAKQNLRVAELEAELAMVRRDLADAHARLADVDHEDMPKLDGSGLDEIEQEQLARLHIEIVEARKQNASSHYLLDKARRELSTLREWIAEAVAKIERARGRVASCRELDGNAYDASVLDRDHLAMQVDRLESDLECERTARRDAERQLAETRSELDRLKSDVAANLAQGAARESHAFGNGADDDDRVAQEIESMREELERERQSIRDKTEALSKAEGELDELRHLASGKQDEKEEPEQPPEETREVTPEEEENAEHMVFRPHTGGAAAAELGNGAPSKSSPIYDSYQRFIQQLEEAPVDSDESEDEAT